MSHKHGETRVFTDEGYKHTIKEDGTEYQEKSLLEKFGITPGPWEKDYNGTEHHIKSIADKNKWTPTVCRYNDDFKDGDRPIVADSLTEKERQANGKLIAAAPEMLEILIEVEKSLEDAPGGWGYLNELMRSVIEKACYPKSWEEIKELI